MEFGSFTFIRHFVACLTEMGKVSFQILHTDSKTYPINFKIRIAEGHRRAYPISVGQSQIYVIQWEKYVMQGKNARSHVPGFFLAVFIIGVINIP